MHLPIKMTTTARRRKPDAHTRLKRLLPPSLLEVALALADVVVEDFLEDEDEAAAAASLELSAEVALARLEFEYRAAQ
jgi:hypothetical protein